MRALAAELGASFTIDPTITPHINGDRSLLALNIPRADLKQVIRDPDLVGSVEEFCAPPPAGRRRRDGWPAVQRRPQRLLRLALRRHLSVRAIPAAQRQRRASRAFSTSGSIRPSSMKSARSHPRPAGVLDLRARRQLHALPGAGLDGRQHARPFDAGLREVIRAHGDAERKYAAAGNRAAEITEASRPLAVPLPRSLSRRVMDV